MNHLFPGDSRGFSLHWLGFPSNKAICFSCFQVVEFSMRLACGKDYNSINIYFYAMNISFVKIFRKITL